jgi:hypothetical protein
LISPAKRTRVSGIVAGVLSFEAWKKLLLNDCISLDKEREYKILGDSVLRLLYDSGLNPSMKAIAGGKDKGKLA